MPLITTAEAASILGVSARRVTALIQAGRIPVVMRAGNSYLIERRSLSKVKNRKRGRPKK